MNGIKRRGQKQNRKANREQNGKRNRTRFWMLFLALAARPSLYLQAEKIALDQGYSAGEEVRGEDGAELPLLFVVQARDGDDYYIVDHARYIPDEAKWN